MRNTTSLLLIFLFLALPAFGQFRLDTLYCGSHEIRVFHYRLQQDTVIHAYCDHHTPWVWEKRKAGKRTVYRDVTFDSIYPVLRKAYGSYSFSATEMHNAEPIAFTEGELPVFSSEIVKDAWWIGAINHYTDEIGRDSLNALSYYNLVMAWEKYRSGYPFNLDKMIGTLNTSIRLNPRFADAYWLKATLHERNARFKGSLVSPPDLILVDSVEMQSAIRALDEVLKLDPANTKARKKKNEWQQVRLKRRKTQREKHYYRTQGVMGMSKSEV